MRANDGVTVAYSVIGDGAGHDCLHLELGWEEPAPEHFWSRLAACARVVLFDRRGAACRIARRRARVSALPPWCWMPRQS